MIAIVDYGVGNLFSLQSSLKAIGAEAVVSGNPDVIQSADKIILPGVGAFRDAINKLNETGLGEILKEEAKKGKIIMGICLGMQLLFEKSYEFGEYEGLGLLKGSVKTMKDIIPADYKLPQIGWNSLKFNKECPLFKYINEGDYVYFVHSFYADCDNETLASYTDYGAKITASVSSKNVFGCQFHPEKSGNVGLNILRAFAEMEGVS